MSHSSGINATRARLHFKAERLFGFIEQFCSRQELRRVRARNANKWRHPSIPVGKIKTVNLPDGVCDGFCTDCAARIKFESASLNFALFVIN